MVDKNLFLHDLAVVAILKNEAPYLKEWLDYHLLAGVDHFYLYDNDSPDNQAEIAAPYVKAGFVDYFHAPGKGMQYAAYNDAVKRFKFHCRYMAFIDGDEFIYPKTNQSIVETLDEILSATPQAAALAINWQLFGSNGLERADLSRGVLERFTRRAPTDWAPMAQINDGYFKVGNVHIKSVANPRRIKFIDHPHYLNYFDNFYAVNENGKLVKSYNNDPVTAEKIAVNHYYAKSREEFANKLKRGPADHNTGDYITGKFNEYDRNEVFDDGILHYAAARMKTFQFPDKNRTHAKVLNALTANLVPTFFAPTPKDFYRGKFETFLTCRALAEHLKTKFIDESSEKFFEEAALKAALKSLQISVSIEDMSLFIGELPKLLHLPYPVVDDLRKAALELTEQLKSTWRLNVRWKDFVELDYLQEILRS